MIRMPHLTILNGTPYFPYGSVSYSLARDSTIFGGGGGSNPSRTTCCYVKSKNLYSVLVGPMKWTHERITQAMSFSHNQGIIKKFLQT